MSSTKIREILLDEISKEVFGPHEKDETFVNTNHPKARYLSGVLYPIQTPVLEDDDQNSSTQIRSRIVLRCNLGGLTCSRFVRFFSYENLRGNS